MERNMGEVIDAADTEGRYSFIVKKYEVRTNIVAARGDELLRELLRAHFCTFTTCTLKTGGTRRWTDGVDATATVDEHGHWTVGLSLAKLFHLPGRDPYAELAELRSFFNAMKLFFEQHASSRASVVLCGQDAAAAPGSGLECRYPVVLGLATVVDEAHTARLRALVDDSAVLQAFLAGLAQAGHTVGPWEFGEVTEAMLYGLCEGPAMRRYLEEQRDQRLEDLFHQRAPAWLPATP